MRATALRRVTIILVSLMVSGCAVLRPQSDPMDMASLPPASSMSKSTLAPLDSDLPFARNFDVALRQAQELRKRGELDQASRVLAQLVLASPDDPRVVGEYGKVMLESGRTNDAVAFLERAVDLQPSDWSLFSALGVAYDQSGKREAARAAFQRALTIKPGESTVLSNLAVSHMQAGELDEAERLLLQASEQSKDVPGIAAKLATVRNIRTTSAQSRPLTVSALPQPAPTQAAASEIPSSMTVPVMSPDLNIVPQPIDVVPVSAVEPVSQEPLEEEDPAVSEEDETETVAALPPPPAPPVATVFEPKSRSINELPAIVKASTQRAAATAAPAPRTVKAPAKAITASQKPRPEPKPVAVQTPPRVSVSAQVVTAQPKEPAADRPAIAPPAPVVAVAPMTAEPSANASPQTAFMTRRAGVANAVTRTAGAPLVLAPSRDSWESMVRVSLPQSSAAAPAAAEQPDQKIATEPPPESAGWSGILKRWVFAAFGYVTSLWA